MSNLIDGKAFSQQLQERVAKQVALLKEQHDITPGLAVVLVGEDPASQVYVRNKGRRTVEAGMNSFEYKLGESTTQEELLALIDELNHSTEVHGILVQLPLPEHIDDTTVINSVDFNKDVDGFHLTNVGKLATGETSIVPCTPLGCLMLLEDTLEDLSGLHAVVVGRSNIVGKPMASLLLQKNCTVSIAHSRTRDLPGLCRQADILVAAVGRPEMIKGEWIKPGAVILDVGINRISTVYGKTRLVGDVDYEGCEPVAGAITPVPGGVGPMTIACLLHNTLQQACRQHDVEIPELP